MRTKLFTVLSLLIGASLILAACAPAPVQPEPQAPGVTTIVETVEVIVEGTPMVVTATPPPPPAIESSDPSTLVYATFGEPESLDPALDYETAGGEVIQNVYETLVFFNRESAGDFIPQLATEWSVSDDGLEYTFKLREGVTFHNGAELDVEDVAYSFQRGLLLGGYASPQPLLAEPFFGVGIDDVSLLVDETGALADDREALIAADPELLLAACETVREKIVADPEAGTITMRLAQPWGPFLATLAGPWGSILDKDWAIEQGAWDDDCATWQNYYAELSENDPLTDVTNGTGPFMLDQWVRDEQIILVANENYWRTEPGWEGGPVGAPALDRVVIRSVEEWGTRLAMMQAGDADIIEVPRQNVGQVDPLLGESCAYDIESASFDCQSTANPDAAVRLYQGYPQVSRQDVFFTFDIANPEGSNTYIGSGQLDGNGIPPDFFSDIHIRRAFNYCFDWETYINDALVGEAVQSVGILMPGMIGYDLEGPVYSYDPDRCAEEFQAAELRGPNGETVWDVGFRMQIAFNTGNISRQTVAEILAENLASLNENFQVEIIGLPWPAFLRSLRAEQLPLYVTGWQEDIHDPHNWAQPYLTGNLGIYQNKPEELENQFRELVNAGVAASDPAERAVFYEEMNQLVYESAPFIILAVPTGRQYEQRWVNGWYYNPLYANHYYYPLSKN